MNQVVSSGPKRQNHDSQAIPNPAKIGLNSRHGRLDAKGSEDFSRNHAAGLGSAPAPGAAGRASRPAWSSGSFTHRLVRPGTPAFGARARRTAAGAAALPVNSTIWFRFRNHILLNTLL